MAAPAITFDVLLGGLLNKTNEVRKSAEKYYLDIVATPAGLVATLGNLLAYLGNQSVPVPHRLLCAVLTRRLLERRAKNWDKLPAETQVATKAGLLAAFSSETQRFLQEKIAHTVAEVAATSGGPACSGWPELLGSVFTLAQAPAANQRCMALYVFSRLAEYDGPKLLAPHADKLLPVMTAMLGDADNSVRVAAMQATISLIAALDADEPEVKAARTASQALIPKLLDVMQKALGTDEIVARDALASLIDLVRMDPHFLRPHIETACRTMVLVAEAEGLDEQTRRLGLEFMVTLAEYAGATLRKMVPFIKSVLTVALKALCMVEEDASWAAGEDDPHSMIGDEAEGDHEEMVIAACSALDRMAFGVGGKAFWPILTELLAPLLSSADWRHRRAGLIAIALSSEGCKAHLAPTIRSVVQVVVPFFRDPHPRVRHAAARCLGEMIGDYSDPLSREAPDPAMQGDLTAPTVGKVVGTGTAARAKGRETIKRIQEVAADLILPALIEGMGEANAAAPRVRAICAQASVNYTLAQYCEEENLNGQGKDLLHALFKLLTDVPLKSAKEAALTSVGCIADCIRESFRPFYATFVGIAKSLLATCVGKEYATMRGKALQCVSLIIAAVGREVAGTDSAEMLNHIVREVAVAPDVAEDDADGFDFMVMSIVRIADTLGADFVPYLQFVMPVLFQHASKDVDVTVLDADGPDDDADEEEEKHVKITEVNMPGMGKRKLAINPNKLSTKLAAMSGLVSLIEDLGVEVAGFRPFIKPATEIFVRNLQAPFASLREMAANSVQYLLMAALHNTAEPAQGQQVFEACLNELMNALDEERMVEVQLVFGEALTSLLNASYESLCDGDAIGGPTIAVPPQVIEAAAVAAAFRNGGTGAAAAAPPAVGGAGAAAAAKDAEEHTPHTVAVVPADKVEPLLELLQQMIESSVRRRNIVIREYADNPDADEEEGEKLQQELAPEDDFMSHCVDATGYIIKSYRAAILPALGKVMYPYISAFLGEKGAFKAPLRSAAICMMDDMIEHCSPEAHVLVSTVVPAMLEAASKDEECFVRQAACYGLGVCAVHAGDAFTPFAVAAGARLYAVVTDKAARSEDNLSATENAVSALIKLAKYRGTVPGVDVNAIMAGALAMLPFKADGIEARAVHGWLITGIATMDPMWIGADGSRFPAALTALANALVAHKVNMDGAAAAAGEDDEEEEDTDDALILPVHLAQLPAIFAGIKAGPHAAAVAALVRGMKKKQQAALAEYGLA